MIKIIHGMLGVLILGTFVLSSFVFLAGLDITYLLLAIISGYLFVDITKIEMKGE